MYVGKRKSLSIFMLRLFFQRLELTGCSFIEENNDYKNAQKELQSKQRMPPGMPSQDMMAFWGKSKDSTKIYVFDKLSRFVLFRL